MRYRDSGVNIDKASRIKRKLSQLVQSTWSGKVLSEIGQFGGLFALAEDYEDPVLVSSIDGVGTKVLVARKAGRFETVGQDLVNHCVNDILVQGASPLFFLDYIAAGSLDEALVVSLVEGLSKACKENGCALIGGETAEMPGLYQGADFDLAGCVVGVVEREKIIDGSRIGPGDVIFAFPSNGLHTNGYSLVRRIIFDNLKLSLREFIDELGCTVEEELLRIHTSYVRPVSSLLQRVDVKGLAHITGGGVVGNVPRILPDFVDADIRRGTWFIPPIFKFLQERGSIEEEEMYRVFNMGLGMIAIIGAEDEEVVQKYGEDVKIYRIGEVRKGRGEVVFS